MGRKLALSVGFALVIAAAHAESLQSAKVSRVENQVSYGKIVGDKSETRPAEKDDVIKSNNFLLSETDSRAELRYEDGTIVRIGQNTIFTFDSANRVFNLKKGTFVFYVPKGKGGGTIKTPTFTAAITGTIGKISNNICAVIEGQITLVPSGKIVPEGHFARFNADGTIEILPFDPAKEYDGKLMSFNGPLPGLPESAFGSLLTFFSELGYLDSSEKAHGQPGEVNKKNPPPTATPRKEDKPTPTPPPPTTPTPTPHQQTPPPTSTIFPDFNTQGFNLRSR